MTRLALGIDLGTSGVRTAVLDDNSTLISTIRATYGAGEGAYREPENWWSAVLECLEHQIQDLAEKGFDPRAVGGIAVDGTSGSLVLTDTHLKPVTRALMYNQSGFEAEAEQIAKHAPTAHIARGSGSALARALHLVAEDAAARATHLLHQADFIAARLMGRGGLTDYNNALKTGLDPETGTWPSWFRDLGLHDWLLPQAAMPGAPFAKIEAGIANQFGLSDAVVIHAGTTDSIAAFLASAKPEPGVAVTSLGTTLAVKLCSTQRVDAPEFGLYAHRVGPSWLVGGASNTGGGVLKTVFSDDELKLLSARIDPETESPLEYYPLVAPGERFPVNDPGLAPRMTPRPSDDAAFLHGLLESMARIEKRAYEVMVDHGAPAPTKIITAGGGAQNVAWNAIRSRVLGLPVEKARFTEAAIGAARLAGYSTPP